MPRKFKLKMNEEQIEREMSILVTDLGLLYRKYFNRQMRGTGLTAVQWQVLSCIARHEGMAQTEIAEMLNKGKASVGKTLDSLELAGWVVKDDDKSDRRVKKVYLTNKLDTIQDSLLNVMGDMNNVAESGLRKEDIAQLRANLTQVRNNLQSGLED
jgi:MarR family transcriptional regulator, transcriptional regulator for hemolysin